MKFDVNLVRHKFGFFEMFSKMIIINILRKWHIYKIYFTLHLFNTTIIILIRNTHNLIVFKLSYFLLQFIFDLNKQPCLSVSIHSFLLFYNLHYAIQLNKRSAVYFIRHYHWHRSLRKLIALLSNPSATTFEKLNNAYLALGCINLTMHFA